MISHKFVTGIKMSLYSNSLQNVEECMIQTDEWLDVKCSCPDMT